MSQTNAHATLDAVHKEIESTLQSAESSLGRFLEDRNNGEDLQNCVDCLNQLRGIFVVVELTGAGLLCEEAVAIATDVPVGASEDKDDMLSTLSDAVFILKKYAEYLSSENKAFPELLIDPINRIRIARKAPLIQEVHFHDYANSRPIDIVSVFAMAKTSLLSDFEHHAPRFRHMYQTGLLELLRNKESPASLKLIQRAAEGSARLCVGYNLSSFWHLIALLARELHAGDVYLTDVRKRIFMRTERFLRAMALEGKSAADKPIDESIVREAVFLLNVIGSEDPATQELVGQLEPKARYDEGYRVAQAKKFDGPGGGALDSLAKAVNEDLMGIKEKLDLFERGTHPSDEDLDFVSDGLRRLSGILAMLNLPNLGQDCGKKAEIVASWAQSGHALEENELLAVADAIIGVEAAIAKYKESGQESDQVFNAKDPDNHYLKEARAMVVEESHGGLALAKRAISAYIESGGDKLHLANITQALDCSRGGMFLMGRERVAAIIATCESCIKSELIDRSEMPNETLLETLADALSSVEFYIEGLSSKASANEDLLKLSEDSLKSIGYEVAA